MNDKIIVATQDIEEKTEQSTPSVPLQEISIGAGARAMKADESGLWLGADKFADAPFSVDMDGNVIANSIKISDQDALNSANGLNQQFTSGSEADITNATKTLIIERPTIVLAIATVTGWVYQASGSGDWFARGIVRLYEDSTEKLRNFITGGKTGTNVFGLTDLGGITLQSLSVLQAGTHVIKLTGVNADATGNGAFNVYRYSLSIVTLGNV